MPIARVCHISTVHTGVEIRIVRKQLASLAAAGFDAHLIITATDQDVAETRAMGITTQALPKSASGSRAARMTGQAWRMLKMARAVKADIYHFHDAELIPVGLALKAAGHRVVMDVHEDLKSTILVKRWIKPWLRQLVSRSARGAELFGGRRFDAVVAAYPYVGSIFEGSAKRVAVIRNFPLRSELEVAESALPWASRDRCAYVGTISQVRGINEVIDALPLADARLLLAGRWTTKAEHEQAMARPGWRMVDELGYVDRQGIKSVMDRSYVGLCTLYPVLNHIHTEPIKMFEYMAAGIPVVASTIPRWREFVEGADCGVCVEPKDPAAVAQAIRYFRDNPDQAQRMGRNGRKAVLEQFNWDGEATKLVALYHDILKG